MSNQPTPKVSRREFLKRMGAGAAAMAAAHMLASPLLAAEQVSSKTPGMLIDLTRCTGCNSCALACREANNLPGSELAPPTGLNSTAYSFVDTQQAVTTEGQIVERNIKRQCMHCLDPACVSACPAAAMYKSKEGPIVYRAERCLGCRYCQIGCPFGVPAFEWENGLTPVISKCWLCYERLQEGERPACADACPTGAIRFGRRDQLLAQAHAQIASNPGRYIDHIFGEFEVGGTSMLYLSDIPFAELGFPANLPHTAPPEETEKIMSQLPAVIGGVTVLMAGAAVFTHRNSPKASEMKNEDPDGQED